MTDFSNYLPDIAATEDEVLDDLRGDLQTEGSTIANTSKHSPFFRLMGVIFATPLLYLRGMVLGTIMPGMFVQTASGGLLDILAFGLDETRLQAGKAAGNLTFTRAGTVGALAIPLGTEVESPAIDGVIYKMITTVAGTIPDGQSTALVAAEAELVGSAHNLGDGYFSVLPVAVPGITGVSNDAGWLTTPGRDLETDDELRERLRLKWKRQSGWHTADTYRSLISDNGGVKPEDVYFDLAAPRGAGSADAFLVTAAGIPSGALVTQVDDYINVEGNHGLGDDLQVKAIPALPQDIAVDITAVATASTADKTQLQTDVEDLIRAAFRESAAYPTVARVAPSKLLSWSGLAVNIFDEFALVESVNFTAPAADVVPGLTLPTINTLAVTVL